MGQGLTFDAEKHEYRVDGVPIPSVTQILKAAGLVKLDGVPLEMLERASQFGRAVHAVVEYECKGVLDQTSVDPLLEPYVNGWRKFVTAFNYRSIESEIIGYCRYLYYGYTIDQIGQCKLGDILLDIKTGVPKPADRYQIAGYRLARRRIGQRLIPVLLYLNPTYENGFYVQCFTNTECEENVFLAAIALYNTRVREGLL